MSVINWYIFDRRYQRYGFTPLDGPSVHFSWYEIELFYKRYHWRGTSGRVRFRIKCYLARRDGKQCKYCKKPLKYKEMTIDHFFPDHMWFLDFEYDDTFDTLVNLVIACEKCNLYKGKKSPLDWVLYPRDNLSIWRRLYIWFKRKRTNIKLILTGVKTISGKHKGWYYQGKKGYNGKPNKRS